MTLNVTASEIQIKNASGQVKFTSNDKLLYLLRETTGTVPVAGQTILGLNTDPFTQIPLEKRVPIISVKINSCNGSNFPGNLIGTMTPANRTIVVHFAAGATNRVTGRVSPYGNMGTLNVGFAYQPFYESGWNYPTFYSTVLTLTSIMFNDEWGQGKLWDFGLYVTYYYRMYTYL